MVTLGYHGYNKELRAQHILLGRTARLSTVIKKGKRYLQELFHKNVLDLLKIIQWNIDHDIHLYRISSDLAPHITNPKLIIANAKLAYSFPEKTKQVLKKIGQLAKNNKMRITFHPGIFVTLNSPNSEVIKNSIRDIYYHVELFHSMGLTPEDGSLLVLHGGGIYNDKSAAMTRWVNTFCKMSHSLRKYLVIENDEKNYSIDDVLRISNQIKKRLGFPIPVLFDIFHYKCYQSLHPGSQSSLDILFPKIIRTWTRSTVKMHIAEQKPGARLGTHADYVETIPKILLQFPKKYGRNLDLMIESKMHELSLLYLRKKYRKQLDIKK